MRKGFGIKKARAKLETLAERNARKLATELRVAAPIRSGRLHNSIRAHGDKIRIARYGIILNMRGKHRNWIVNTLRRTKPYA